MLVKRAVCTVCLFFVSIQTRIIGHKTTRSGDTRAGRRWIGIRYWVLHFLLLLAAASPAQAGLFCTDPPFNGVVDGSIDYTIADPTFVFPTQITIDAPCTFQNFTADNPLVATLNFQTTTTEAYLIIFDNVVFSGNLACANIDHKLWVVNTPDDAFNAKCQDIFIPAETISKQSAVSTASIGVPFTYTLTLPAYTDDPFGIPSGPSPNDLGNIVLTDDINATGASLSLVGTPTVTWVAGGAAVHTFSNAGGLLTFELPDIPSGSQIEIDITVVLNDVPANTAGTSFINTANWKFSRLIDLDGPTGPLDPQFFDPLPGEAGVADPIIIAEPVLIVTKTSPDSALNIGARATFFIDVQNTGGSDAWNVTILDQMPDGPTAGMCDHNPLIAPGVSVQIFEADGVTDVSGLLVAGSDYLISYSAASCQLSLIMLSDAAVIGPTERLIISYQSQLDADTTGDGLDLINIAGATQWFSAKNNPRRAYSRTLTDGTPGTPDHEDNYTVITGLSGYFFQKTVENLTSGANPATTAAAGDRLRYRLRLFNVDQTFTNISLDDVLDPTLFNTATFTMATPNSFDPVSGLLQISPPDVVQGDELIYEFEINLDSSLLSPTVVPNQAIISATDNASQAITINSDDPFINGIAAPGDPADPTRIVIYSPGPLSKAKVQDTATIGEIFTYIIKVPANTVNVPLYDVRIQDVLGAPDLIQPSNVDLNFISATVISGGAWALSNTGTASNITLEDLSTGIDIPANGQAIIEVSVELLNTTTNQAGLSFTNTATYTYNRTNGVIATQTDGEPGSSGSMTVLEPNIIEITKAADNIAPAIGDIVKYTVTLRAESGVNLSDVFDVTLTDNLDPGLVYAGSPTVSVGVAGSVSENNVIGAPDIIGDGSVATPQILYWGLNSNELADIDIVAGETIALTYNVLVLNTVLANQTLSNSVVAQWTGLEGVIGGERNGSDGVGGLNDYITSPVVAIVTTPNITVPIVKSRVGDTYPAGDVRIGDMVEYEFRLSVPEATLGNLVLTDTLPQGLMFENIVSINGNTGPLSFPATGTFSHAPIAATDVVVLGNASIEDTTVSWTLGNLTNLPIDGANNDFVIVYRARVLNNVFAHSILTIPLLNSVAMAYDTATARVTSTVTETINALQPMLRVTKTAMSAGGFTVVNAGEVVTYTVDIHNDGTAPAYDVVLQDIIPIGMRNAVPVVTMISSDLTSGAGYLPLAPSYNSLTGLATWDFDTGVDGAYMIPAGETLRVVYQVQVDAVINPGQTIANAATATLYYSLDDDSVPSMTSNAGTVTDIRETYGPSNTASAILYTADPPSKVLNPVISEATIGQEVIYHIRVPANLSYASLHDVVVSDTLPPELEFIDVTEVSGNNFALVDSISANNLTVNIVQIPLGQQAVLAVRTRVANNAAANAGDVITNIASYRHAFSPGGTQQPALSSSVTGVDDTFTIVEPELTLGKDYLNLNAPGSPPTAGNILRYSVVMTATGGVAADDYSDVFDAALTDSMSLGLAYQANSAQIDGVAINDPSISGDGVNTAQVLTWSLADTTTDIDIVEGTFVTVTYEVLVLDTVQIGQVLSNSAQAQWTSLDGADINERDGAGCPTITPPDDYCSAAVTTTVTVPDNTVFAKDRITDTFDAADVNVRIGDIVEYRLRMTLQEGNTPAVVLTDVLPQGMAFEGVVSINGITTSPYTAVPPFTHEPITPSVISDPTSGSTTVTFNIGDIINAGDNNPANDNFEIIYRARILNDVLPQVPSTALINTANMNYTLLSGLVTRTSSYNLTLLQPVLTVSKSAAAANLDTVLDANELVRYTVDIVNGGLAPAYDVVLQDIIPIGMRYGTVTVTIISSDLEPPIGYAALAPDYSDPATGIATWNFDSGIANAYTIGPGETLRVVYDVSTDVDLGPDMSLTNSAQATLYYSLDDEDPAILGGITGVRQQYGPTLASSVTLTTALPNPLVKQNTQTTATFGVPFSYTIRVPDTPMTTALNDVRIIDDLSMSAADLSYVSVTKISGSQPWVPENTGTAPIIVIEDTVNGIDIPAGEFIEIEITVELNDSATNVEGLLFNNTATYTYNRVNDDPTTQGNGIGNTTANMTIVAPDDLIMDKRGPINMRLGLPGTFYLDITNAGTSPAWDLTVTDLIPNPDPGGMCDLAPSNITAQLYNGATAVLPALQENIDFSVAFINGTPNCTVTFTMMTPAAAIPAGYRLLISYDLMLDADTIPNSSLTNIAAATKWFSADTDGVTAIGQTRTYTELPTDGTPGFDDHEDAHTVLTEIPIVLFQKTVVNLTSGQNIYIDQPIDANPGDRLQFTIVATNVSPSALPDFSITDELDRLNASPMFAAGSLDVNNIIAPVGADILNSDANGGSQSTGLLDVRNLSLDPMNGINDSLTIVFEVNLAPVITSGTTVLNQAEIVIPGIPLSPSDDPNINGVDDPNIAGDEDPTPILIDSWPLFQIHKTSEDVTGSATELVAGDTLRYTITVKNVGTEDAVNATLTDQIPANTTYIAGTTTLNGIVVPDPVSGTSVLPLGMLINAPENTTPGYMRADATATTSNVASISFDVVVNADALDGTVLSNQAFLAADGIGISGPVPPQPSDDPATAIVDDPTRDVVGNVPLIDSQKTVVISVDGGTLGIVDPGDTLQYTITVTNYGAIPATGVRLLDDVPVDTTYVTDSVYLNGLAVGQPDAGVSPLIAGIDVSSSDLTPPLPAAGVGYLSPGATATVTFEVVVDALVARGTVISNQGFVYSNELPIEPTDADGLDSNGDQPTLIVVGDAQQLAITKEVSVIGAASAMAGGQLEYVVRVTNVGLVPASNVIIYDDLDFPVANQMTYVAGSGTLNGFATGVSYLAPIVTADYSTTYGLLQPGATATLRFRVTLDANLAIGTTVTNRGQVYWDAMNQTATASVSIDIGGTPGVANLNGSIWHDSDFDDVFASGERAMVGWSVEVYFKNVLLGAVPTDANGVYRVNGLAPNYLGTDRYELRFVAPGAGPISAKLGQASSVFVNGLHTISDIVVYSGNNLQDLNLPIEPNGVVYDSIVRSPIVGASVSMLSSTTGIALPPSCFDDPAQQNQVTLADGYYKFDINFSQPECSAGSDFVVTVSSSNPDYVSGESVAIPPLTSATTTPFSVPTCAGSPTDAVIATANHCEVQTLAVQPPLSISPQTVGTNYHLHLTLNDAQLPGNSQLFNNHIPLDPDLGQVVTISKVSSRVNVSRGDLVPYTIVINNTLVVPLTQISVVDNFPAGFKYVRGSARVNGVGSEPTVNGLQLTWDIGTIAVNTRYRIELLLVVGAGVQENEYVNRAYAASNLLGNTTGEATATVRVVPDPTFDCSDIIGKVFDDKNLNGYQDPSETGIADVRLATATGLLVTTDAHGRFHITCAATPNEQRGSNFILKIDPRTLPSGYRITTENPRVIHLTRGKLGQFNFGATIHRVVTLDVADGVFEHDNSNLRRQWVHRLGLLMDQLRDKPSLLRIAYMADVEDSGLVQDRLDELKARISKYWDKVDSYKLTIETEIYWRNGGPMSDGGWD